MLGLRAGYQVFKWLLPVVILVHLLQWWGVDIYLNMAFAPLMSLMGLPEWTSIVWVTAILANLYAGLTVFAAGYANESLTVAQISILGTVMLIAHSLPVEGRIAQLLGVRIVFILLIRLGTALILGIILNLCYSSFDVLQQPVTLFWQLEPAVATGLLARILAELWDLLLLFLIIVSLVVVLEVLKQIGIVRFCELLLQPLLRLLGISERLAHIMTVGCLLGLTYGSGLLVAEAKKYEIRDVAGAVIFISLCHALIEDTLLMLLIGADLSAVLFARLFISLLLVGLLMRLGKHYYFLIFKTN